MNINKIQKIIYSILTLFAMTLASASARAVGAKDLMQMTPEIEVAIATDIKHQRRKTCS